MTALNAIAQLRKNRAMHLGQELATHGRLASLIVEDAIHLGMTDVRVNHVPPNWTLISAERDWTRLGSGGDLLRSGLFARLVPFPEAGINEIRHEVYLAAYCGSVFLVDTGLIESIVGSPPPSSITQQCEQHRFYVGFGFAEPDKAYGRESEK